MKSSLALVILILTSTSLIAADEPIEKRENASTRLFITRATTSEMFRKFIRDFHRLNLDDQPVDWVEVNKKIDKWFAEEKEKNSSDYKIFAADWDKLCDQSKKDAHLSLAPLNELRNASVRRTAAAFKKSERAFYRAKPHVYISGTFRYLEGQRDVSSIHPSWQLKSSLGSGSGYNHFAFDAKDSKQPLKAGVLAPPL